VNYRHRFHAGNAADVFKHHVLLQVLDALCARETAFCVVESHAGSGLYRLKAPGEFEQGIGRLWPVQADWPGLAGYFARVAAYNRRGLKAYPGSPLLIADSLRRQDRAVFVEHHPDEAAFLRDNLYGRPRIAVHTADGFALLKALLPPPENRGLVLIDPPYEQTDEFTRVAAALREGLARWRNGIYMAWYPIKARRPVERLQAAVRELRAEAMAVEFLLLPEDVPQRLNGSGVILANPPWKLAETLERTLTPLAAFLAGASGRPQVRVIRLGPDRNPSPF
jgi:23S rRNA (adenine2030-N6)-methyltransferase